MGNGTGLDVPTNQQRPDGLRTMEEVERWKRDAGVPPDLLAAERLRADLRRSCAARIARRHERARDAAGANRQGSERARQRHRTRGRAADRQRRRLPARPADRRVRRWRCTSTFPANIGGDGYPVSLIGAIAFVRQSFLDAQHQQLVAQRHEKRQGRGTATPGLRSVARRACRRRSPDGCQWRSRRIWRARFSGRSTWRRSSSSIRHHRRPRGRPGRERAEGQERAGDLQPELPDPVADAGP